MAEEALSVVSLSEDFYRDSFGKVIMVIACLCISIAFLIAVSIYLFLNQPQPITFHVAEEWRVQPPVPIQQPYLSEADVLQWVSNVVPKLFELDFMHMDDQIASAKRVFTDNGYLIYQNQIKNIVDIDTLNSGKLFLHAEPSQAPGILNQGVLTGRYAWWVQIPVNISYAGMRNVPDMGVTLQVLVVRTDTTDNLTGILIDNVIVEREKSSTNSVGGA